MVDGKDKPFTIHHPPSTIHQKMICPNCGHDNLPGAEECSSCLQDLTQLDRPVAHDRVERSLMEDTVGGLRPAPALTVPPHWTVGEAVEAMMRHQVGALLVVDEQGRLLGIFSERDLLTKVAGECPDWKGQPVREYMTLNPETVTADHTLAFALHKMDVGGYRHLPVMDEGKPVGVVSVRDMLRHITRILTQPPSHKGKRPV
jgi:CBS domain-containing protein